MRCCSQNHTYEKPTAEYLLVIVADELSCAGVDGSHEKEDNAEENDGLNLPDGDAGLNVQLGKGSLAGHNLANNGSNESELCHSADKQLVCLGEAEDGS